ncbi:MAG: 3-hydroxybutyryl-CoA dehydrogenase [bacterium TMED198]|nr:MAG: 3-hydroxybutyryl-CoA dehydrogenase [bacterium TMED198]
MQNKSIGVVGAGTMGNGIAHVFALHGFSVTLADINPDALKWARSNIKSNLNRQLDKGLINQEEVKASIDRINTSVELKDLSNCSLVIEAASESLEIKKKIFKNLDTICSEDTILASNTSSISINRLASSTSRKGRVIGMHFMNPVPIMKLVEIICGKNTSSSTKEMIESISKKINKIPLFCNDSPGFVSNRILMPMINEAAFSLMEGVADKEAIDGIMKLGMGHPIGPLKLADLIGIDICLSIILVLREEFDNPKYDPCPLLEKMVQDRKLGRKTGEGFYKYK